ncbi:MAG TPA: hypothetical protein VJ464_28365 [Blastocatellia bacterium]|nr:hypothetical protein [Blastocatellia bacterium]
MSKGPSISTGKLILIPAVITLAVTLLRLVGELQHWPRALFNPDPGGPGALIGISWLPLVFGIYFAIKLIQAGEGPASPLRAFLHVLVGAAVGIGGAMLWSSLNPSFYSRLLAACVMFLIAAAIAYPGWPALCKTLFAYALAARIPVAILMYFAMRGNWGTHYDAVPPESPAELQQFGPKFLWLALLPQLTVWIGMAVLSGSLTGSITALVKRRKPAEQAAVSA